MRGFIQVLGFWWGSLRSNSPNSWTSQLTMTYDCKVVSSFILVQVVILINFSTKTSCGYIDVETVLGRITKCGPIIRKMIHTTWVALVKCLPLHQWCFYQKIKLELDIQIKLQCQDTTKTLRVNGKKKSWPKCVSKSCRKEWYLFVSIENKTPRNLFLGNCQETLRPLTDTNLYFFSLYPTLPTKYMVKWKYFYILYIRFLVSDVYIS